jgi:UDP-2,3-diacylglucosamine hydrolase
MVVKWLDTVKQDAQEIHLVGDLFDFWFEYKHAVPKGMIRLLGKMAEIADSGIPLHIYTGNHDMWMFDYLPKEIGVILHREPIHQEWNGIKLFIGHGDGLGPGDQGYKFIKRVFASKVCQWLFARLHPNFGIGFANFWSGTSRNSHQQKDRVFLGDEKEWLAVYCRQILANDHFDYFIFGHRHLPLNIEIGPASRYINLGDWISHFTYAVFDGSKMELRSFKTGAIYE